ncbi:MAG: HlyD family efflux transporter periplasmic adaptor subunit [Scytonema sp. PMC 1069.18]|nr:HlyD family efflux transporter periplasmic adaptor subunit [Scytonema sp. PMC 1069.18]MEC4880475.1 HlyD family efflux transporter periplasmic adaptor subunit [Scytonema sp. PMC 1070.18]
MIQHQLQLEQPVLLQQSPTWSRLIAWGIIGITGFTVIWASVFQIEESISVTGKLEPKSAVQEIQAPVGGVVKEIHVQDGQQVKKGQILVNLSQTTTTAELAALQKNRVSLLQKKQVLQQEKDFYLSQIKGNIPRIEVTKLINLLGIKPELAYLTKSRVAIASENQLYRTQLQGFDSEVHLTPDQQLRLYNRQTELASRLEAAKLESEQIQQQIFQNQAQIDSAKELLNINQNIINKFKPLLKDGAISQLQYLKQQQDVSTKKAEVIRFTKEQRRLQLALAQSQSKLRSSVALSQEDLLAKITTNEQRLADIDSQLSKVILENQQRILEINSQVSDIDSKLIQAKETLKYQTINSPVNGTIFELKAKFSGFVVNSSEPILKIVPTDNLVAQVYITNRDIGFVKEGQKVDVRIDSFPFQEYGDIKGKLIEIGSDALPPDQIYQYWRFPAKVRLDGQTLLINNRQVPLQSGMSINANIKLRKRTILSIFTDFMVQKAESLKFVR